MRKIDILSDLLFEKYKIDQKICAFINSEDKSLRFFHKKFVGDIGEYYFKKQFKKYSINIEQSQTSNAEYDFLVQLNEKGKNKFKIKNAKSIKIEVKTRYDQKGINHIFGIEKRKFDMLAFIKLDAFYQCVQISLVQKRYIKTDNQKRIRFTDKLKPITVYQNKNYKIN